MSQKEKEIFEAQLMKEAEIRDRLKEASSSRFSICLVFKGAMSRGYCCFRDGFNNNNNYYNNNGNNNNNV